MKMNILLEILCLLGEHKPFRTRYWFQDLYELNIPASMLGEHVIGPFGIDGNSAGEKYHSTVMVRQYLEKTFPNQLKSGLTS